MTQEFETTLIPQDIVVRQSDGDNEYLEDNGGLWFPLIKVNNTVFHKDKISGFSYNVGTSLVPTCTVTLNDHDKSFMEEEFPNIDDIITIRISNNDDVVHKPIKLDFLIIDISSSPNSRYLTIEAVQYIPILHEYNNVGWNDSLYNITKTIAKESGLGFVSNMSDSGDSSNWICPDDYYSYLSYIEERMFISSDDTCKIFVDQYNNLNVVSMKSSFNDRNVTRLLTNPSSGTEYDENVNLTLSNKIYNNGEQGDEDLHVQINGWSPFTNYGIGFLTSKSIAKYSQKSSEVHLNSPTPSPVSVQNINALESSEVRHYGTFVDGSTVFGDILMSRKQNKRLKSIYKQGTYITANLEFYVPDIFSYMYIPVDIYNKGRNAKILSQDENVELNELSEKSSKYEANVFSVNNEFTGDYLIVSNEYVYVGGNENSNLTQTVTMIKI